MKSPFRPPAAKWPTALATAGAGAILGVLITRNFFETEKKIKHPLTPDFSVGDPSFSRTMSDLLGPPLLPGNAVTILQNGVQIFPAMLEAIRSAERSITLENFVWREGRLTRAFAEALAERAAAGLKVHMIQDALGARGLRGPSMNLLRRSRVELEIFRWLYLSQLNLRTHRKLLIIDGRIGFIGGAGIADDWDGNADAPEQWRDTHYRVEGPVVAQMQSAWMENWMQTRARVLHGDDYFPELVPRGELSCQTFKSSSSEGADSARVMFYLSLAAARHTIRIANAYFIPDDLGIRTLVDARQRGVAVEIIVPGPHIDEKLVRIVGRGRWGALLRAGVRIFEYQPTRFHCKYMIIDGCWVSAGSANFDNRSLRLNDEANLNVLDAAFAAEHERVFQTDRGLSREITLAEWEHRPWREKAINAVGSLLRSQL